MKRVKVWYSINHYGDGIPYLDWFLTEEAAEEDNKQRTSLSEVCVGFVETFEDSQIYQIAKGNG